jgi:chemotaxis signal transduction protein
MPPSHPLKRLSNVDEEQTTIRTIVFSLADVEHTAIGKYQFALPVEAVIRAIVYPANRTTLTDGIGMINLGDQTVTIVDLRDKFTKTDHTQDSSRFLILFKTRSDELCGLPVKDAPILIDIPMTTIRPLPLAYREVNQLTFASHAAIVPQEGDLAPLEILLLGMGQSNQFSAQTSVANLPALGSQSSHLPDLN